MDPFVAYSEAKSEQWQLDLYQLSTATGLMGLLGLFVSLFRNSKMKKKQICNGWWEYHGKKVWCSSITSHILQNSEFIFTKQMDCFQFSLASKEQAQDRLKLHDLKHSFEMSI